MSPEHGLSWQCTKTFEPELQMHIKCPFGVLDLNPQAVAGGSWWFGGCLWLLVFPCDWLQLFLIACGCWCLLVVAW